MICCVKSPDELWNHLIGWPLVAACSVKVANRDSPFKPEYIIPQLLLQIIRDEGRLHGIRFSSTHINRDKVDLEGTFVNLAIPVKDDADIGYCNSMKGMFQATDPVPWEITEVFLKPSGTFIGSLTPSMMAVKKLSLASGQQMAYEYSTFGKLEETLLAMSPDNIP